jgi:hypothetical protein
MNRDRPKKTGPCGIPEDMIGPSRRGCCKGSVPDAPQRQTRNGQSFMLTSCIHDRPSVVAIAGRVWRASAVLAACPGDRRPAASNARDPLGAGLIARSSSSLPDASRNSTISPAPGRASSAQLARAADAHPVLDPHAHGDERVGPTGRQAPAPGAPRSAARERAPLTALVLRARRSRHCSCSDRDVSPAGARVTLPHRSLTLTLRGARALPADSPASPSGRSSDA